MCKNYSAAIKLFIFILLFNILANCMFYNPFNSNSQNDPGKSGNSGGSDVWYNSNWNYRIKITINNSQVESDFNNFPVLINLTPISDLASNARADGFDILFTMNDKISKINHEIESYNNSTGELYAWVSIPYLSSSVDTVIYLYYGNLSSIDQSSSTAVWDSNYIAVWHLNENVTDESILGTHYDSTFNNYDAGQNGNEDVAGKISNGQQLDGIDDFIEITGKMGQPINLTVSGWVKLQSADSSGAELFSIADCVIVRLDDTTFNTFGSYHDGSSYLANFTSLLLAGPSWYYITYVIDDDVDNQIFYVNGIEETFENYTNSISYVLGTNTFIGTHGSGNTNYDLNGIVDEIRVSNTARSAQWIKTSYNNQSVTSGFITAGAEEIKP